MVTKKIILLLIALSVVTAGCLSSEEKEENRTKEREAGGSSGGSQRQREVRTPEGVQGEAWTPGRTETEGEAWTPERTETEGEMWTPTETGTSGRPNGPEMEKTEVWTGEREQAVAVQPDGTAPTSHLVRLKNYLMIPSSLEINVGDTVVWRNYQESSVLTLTSREHLFEDQRLAYGNTLKYAFNEPGNYNFSVKGYPKMQMTITVK